MTNNQLICADDIEATYQQTSGVVRLHKKSDLHNNIGKYNCIVSVSWIGHDDVFVYGAHGEMGKVGLAKVARCLRDKGAKSMLIEREGRKRFPAAKLIRDGDDVSMWRVESIDDFIEAMES